MKRVIALIVAALVLAGLSGFASFYYLQQADDRARAKWTNVEVYQATTGIPAGLSYQTALDQGLFTAVPLPQQFVLEAMLKPGVVVDPSYVAVRDIAAGQFVMASDWQRTTAAAQVLPIPDGYVALSVGAEAGARLAPFLSPGAHVSMMSNIGGKGPKIVFPDLQVIAIGSVSTIGTGAGGDVPGLLTFAVPADQATEFLAAVQAGGLYFALLPNHSVAVN